MVPNVAEFKRRAPGPLPSWDPESLDKHTSLRALNREIDRIMSFPPTEANAIRVAELSVRAATLALNLRADADSLATRLVKLSTSAS